MSWEAVQAPFGAVVHPLQDVVEHDMDDDTGQDCVCGPQWLPEKDEDGTVWWVLVHHSLDGREQHE